ncbi:TPA: phage major capsid protein, partial [Escherichia coli]|nr:phage major capsid protein [Escherichia coli]
GAVVEHGEEGAARNQTATPKLNEVSIRLYPIYAYPKTTQEIIDFSEVDIMGWLSSEIGDTFVDTEETDLVSGDGEKKAKGFLAFPRTADNDKTRPFGTLQTKKVTGSLSADMLIDLKFTLRNKYRKKAVWVMNSNTAASAQKLKNATGDYIWRDRLQAGDPDSLLGLPVEYLEFMPDGVIAVGDFKRGYFIVDHETGTRTRPDFSEPGFINIYTQKYLGGGVVDSNAIKILEIQAGK